MFCMRRPGPCVLALALVPSLRAQVFVVDAMNRAGTHYTDMPAAIAAVPEGATLLVRAGAYSPSRIDRKALSVVGDGTPSLVLEVARTSAMQPVVLRWLGAVVGSLGLRIVDCQGSVVVENCVGRSWSVERSRNVQILRCSTYRDLGVPATLTAVDSTLLIADSTLSGDGGGFFQGTGGLGLTRSQAVTIGGSLIGSRGRAPVITCDAWLGCVPLQSGLYATSGAALIDSVLTSFGTTILGGEGEPGRVIPCWTTCNNPGAPAAPPISLAGASSVSSQRDYALGHLTGTPARGGRVDFVYSGSEPGAPPGVLVFGDTAQLTSSPLVRGRLLSSFHLVFGPYALSSPFRLPMDVLTSSELGRLYFGQFWVLGANGPLASSPFSFSVVR